MGLDMYAFSAPFSSIECDVDFDTDKLPGLDVIHRWHKHPDLHGWMEELYYAKGGAKRFNCVPVCLTHEDLDRLELAIRTGTLPKTQGFFVGESDGSEITDDLVFITKARVALDAGYAVIYDSWW